MAKSDLVDIVMCVHVRPSSGKAILASDDGDKKKAVWLPTSLIEEEPTTTEDVLTITMPEWLAKEKGLI